MSVFKAAWARIGRSLADRLPAHCPLSVVMVCTLPRPASRSRHTSAKEPGLRRPRVDTTSITKASGGSRLP
jgi:hypothetical protein